MYINETINEINMDKALIEKYNMKEICYFDIETTGFDKDQDEIILISMGYLISEKKICIKQYFSESKKEEKEILKEFNRDVKAFSKCCSYNGIAFDEPFILNRMNKYKLECGFPIKHIDLYRIIRPYYKEMGLHRCNLKTVEKFIGINRKDQIDGGESIELYKRYLELKDEEVKNTILLHNYEDVLDLPYIFKLVNKIDLDENLIRENRISIKQIKYIRYLLSTKGINVDTNLERMSKKNAHKIINLMLKEDMDKKSIYHILYNTY
ncbi:ribonuclease H-like domain-containing protein [Haloimpatiens sp. FM7315]|uniref:ribonuclease H-like domain-containing protein n=1 Tax=Haloimpatiens sp. FM7315 TaxID=3298609 RepID=UPI00370B9873